MASANLGRTVLVPGFGVQSVGIVIGQDEAEENDQVWMLPGPDYESGGEMYPRTPFFVISDPSGYVLVEPL